MREIAPPFPPLVAKLFVKFEEEMKMLAEAEDMVKDLSNKENIDEVIS